MLLRRVISRLAGFASVLTALFRSAPPRSAAHRAGALIAVCRRATGSLLAVLVGFQRRRPLAFLAATSALLLTVPLVSPSAGSPLTLGGVPLFTGWEGQSEGHPSKSRYVHWMTTDVAADAAFADRLGCESAKAGEVGPVLIAFGRQVAGGGTRGFDGPLVLRPYEQIRQVAAGFRDGLSRCGFRGVLVVATSNYRLDDPSEAAAFGQEWAALIGSVGDTDAVRVFGGTDLEPGWGGLEAARAWVTAYKSSGLVLYSNASADGCPLSGHGGPCANGWNTSALAELVWSNGGVALPQIYRLDGAQADQWGVLARLWASTGDVPRFAGAMTQVRACRQVKSSNCPQLSLPPLAAREQLQNAVGDLSVIPVGTDVGWG